MKKRKFSNLYYNGKMYRIPTFLMLNLRRGSFVRLLSNSFTTNFWTGCLPIKFKRIKYYWTFWEDLKLRQSNLVLKTILANYLINA